MGGLATFSLTVRPRAMEGNQRTSGQPLTSERRLLWPFQFSLLATRHTGQN